MFQVVWCCLTSFFVLWVVLVFLGCLVGVNPVVSFWVLFSVVSACFWTCFKLLLLFRLPLVVFCCLTLIPELSLLVQLCCLFHLVWSCPGCFLVASNCFQSFIGGFSGVKLFQDVLGRSWTCYSVSDGFHAVVGDSICLVCFFKGFRWFEIALNNRHLSDRATCRCSRCTSSFSPFVLSRLKCSPWSRRAEFEAAASLTWPSPCTCTLTQCCKWCASVWCTSRLHCPFSCVVSKNFFYILDCFSSL